MHARSKLCCSWQCILPPPPLPRAKSRPPSGMITATRSRASDTLASTPPPLQGSSRPLENTMLLAPASRLPPHCKENKRRWRRVGGATQGRGQAGCGEENAGQGSCRAAARAAARPRPPPRLDGGPKGARLNPPFLLARLHRRLGAEPLLPKPAATRSGGGDTGGISGTCSSDAARQERQGATGQKPTHPPRPFCGGGSGCSMGSHVALAVLAEGLELLGAVLEAPEVGVFIWKRGVGGWGGCRAERGRNGASRLQQGVGDPKP